MAVTTPGRRLGRLERPAITGVLVRLTGEEIG